MVEQRRDALLLVKRKLVIALVNLITVRQRCREADGCIKREEEKLSRQKEMERERR